MYCKYCGNPVDRKTMKCTVCGKPVGSLSGGNSFKELLKGKTNSTPAQVVQLGKSDTQTASIAADVRELRKKAYEKSINYAAIISALCALLCVILLISLFSLSAKNRSSTEEVFESIEALAETTDQKFDEITTALNRESEGIEVSANPEAINPSITKNPESVDNVTPGRTNIAFICQASGDELCFTWLKYTADKNAWLTIDQDNSNFEIISSSSESSLKVINASSEHEGTYICLVEDRDGHVLYSSPVLFSLALDINGNADDPASRTSVDSTTDEGDGIPQNGGYSYPFGGQP
jgi:hypothetical protein